MYSELIECFKELKIVLTSCEFGSEDAIPVCKKLGKLIKDSFTTRESACMNLNIKLSEANHSYDLLMTHCDSISRQNSVLISELHRIESISRQYENEMSKNEIQKKQVERKLETQNKATH